MSGLLIEGALIDGRGPLCVRIRDGRIDEIATRISSTPGETRLDGAGGALLPGLRDHHIHLMATAAALHSVRCGPPEVKDRDALSNALRSAAARAGARDWVRGVGYHEGVAGELDRDALDALAPGAGPMRIQHRSGALWVLNSAGVAALALDGGARLPAGAERDANGRPNGRFFRLDSWLREQLPAGSPPSLRAVGHRLARLGVTGLCDATPGNGRSALGQLVAAVDAGDLPQRLRVMGGADLPTIAHARVTRGARKLLLDERALPDFDALVAEIRAAHDEPREVAIHCVTRSELVLASEALREAGPRPGDRIEHASVTPPELMALLAALPVRVVTQPNFILERGDAYQVEVDAGERPWLYRCRGFLDAAVPLAGGTDAPFGVADPWQAMRAAVERRSVSGVLLGGDEALDPDEALALFTSPLAAPGAAPARIAPGEPADLCLLARPWSAARHDLDPSDVRATMVAGELTHPDP
jgi:predicted amidohydrolase YtcJ